MAYDEWLSADHTHEPVATRNPTARADGILFMAMYPFVCLFRRPKVALKFPLN